MKATSKEKYDMIKFADRLMIVAVFTLISVVFLTPFSVIWEYSPIPTHLIFLLIGMTAGYAAACHYIAKDLEART